ncbi:hypothetical protein BH18ACI3_BH18ACI3_03320 [soil metagenome]
MKWEDYRVEFEFDGSWRDIYVLNTTISHWQLLIDFLRSDIYEYSCTIDGEKAELPSFAKEIFGADFEFKPLLHLTVGSAILNCHFFTDEEIEFDLDPREIQSERQAEQIFVFMRQIGELLDKEVILTPENLQDVPIFKFLSSNEQVQYIPL